MTDYCSRCEDLERNIEYLEEELYLTGEDERGALDKVKEREDIIYGVWAKVNVAASVLADPEGIDDPLKIVKRLLKESLALMAEFETKGEDG